MSDSGRNLNATFEAKANKGVADGYASLDGTGNVPLSQLGNAPSGTGGTPASTVTGPDAYGAAAVVGTSTDYARADHDHGLPAAPAQDVTSVFTRTGAVVAQAADYADFYPQPLGKTTSGTAAPLPFYNVKDYGAKGDGSTDDTTAISAAISAAAAAGGGLVFLPSGTYVISSQLLLDSTKHGVHVRGAGIYNTVLKWAGAAGNVCQVTGDNSGSVYNSGTFGDLCIDGNGVASTYGLYLLSAQWGTYAPLAIRNCDVCFYSTGASTGTQGTSDNGFPFLLLQPNAGTSGNQTHAFWIDGNGTSGNDTTWNRFDRIVVGCQGGYQTSIRVGFADRNLFGTIESFGGGTRTGNLGLHMDGTVKSGYPTNNLFASLAPEDAFQFDGTIGPFNYIDSLDLADGNLTVPTAAGLSGVAAQAGSLVDPFGDAAPVLRSAESTVNQELATTTATTVVSAPNAPSGLYEAHLYLRVTATATVNAYVQAGDNPAGSSSAVYYFTGRTASSSTTTVLNAVSLSAGSYACYPITFLFEVGSGNPTPIISVSSSVANAVYVSASIVRVG